VRGPLDVLKESWTGETGEQSVMASQVVDMRQKLQEMMGIVKVNAEKAQNRQKHHYDGRAHPCSLAAGEQVVVTYQMNSELRRHTSLTVVLHTSHTLAHVTVPCLAT